MSIIIRKVTNVEDLKQIVAKISEDEILEYLTPKHIQKDFEDGYLYMYLDKNGEIVGISSVVWDKDFEMYYIKRVKVFKQGEGFAKALIKSLSNMYNKLAITPFKCNTPMLKIVSSLGFKYHYTFLENYQLYIYEELGGNFEHASNKQ